jgi:hypothetical protein
VDSGVINLAYPGDAKAPVTAPYAGFRAGEADGALGPSSDLSDINIPRS